MFQDERHEEQQKKKRKKPMVWVAVVVGLRAVVLVWEGVPALLGSEAGQTLRARLTQSQLHKGKRSVGDGEGRFSFGV